MKLHSTYNFDVNFLILLQIKKFLLIIIFLKNQNHGKNIIKTDNNLRKLL